MLFTAILLVGVNYPPTPLAFNQFWRLPLPKQLRHDKNREAPQVQEIPI